MVRARALALLLLLGSSAALAQDTQQPVFRGGIDVIEVDVSVIDGRGRPVSDMREPEFAVTVDGKPRLVTAAQFIFTRPPEPTARATAPEKPDVLVSSNTTAEHGRLVVIAVDRQSISFGQGRDVFLAASKFLDTLGPNDKVAFVTIPRGPIVDFTSNHELVQRELDRMVGEAHRMVQQINLGIYEAFALEQPIDVQAAAKALLRVCGRFAPDSEAWEQCQIQLHAEAGTIVADVRHRADESIRALSSILEALRDVEEQKSLIWISEGLIIEGPGGELGGLERLAAAARTTINVIMLDAPLGDISERTDSPTGREDRNLEVRGLEMLTGRTRGVLFPVSANAAGVFQRMEEQLSGYYLLAVESAPTDGDGKAHPINVSVRRQGVTVRSRRQFQVMTDDAAGKLTPEARLMRTLRSPFAATDFPLRLATYAFQEPHSSKVHVLVATEIEQKTKEPVDLTIAFTLTDRDGKIAVDGMQRAKLTPVEGPTGPLLEHSGAFSIDPGSYTLKLAAIDGDGRRGSIEHPVQAWQMSGVPFAVGDLLLADVPAQPGEPLRPPVEARLASGQLAAYTELYAANQEVFGTTQVKVEVATSESGPALAAGQGRIAVASDPKNRSVSAVVPVAALPPGRYVARAIVTQGPDKVGQLSRPFEITTASVAARVAPPVAEAGTVAGAAAVPAGLLPSMFSPTAGFQRGDLLKADVVSYFMDVLDKGRPALKNTTAQVRSGKMDGTGLQALETGDQLAAAFLRGLELFAKGDLNPAATQFGAVLRSSPAFAPAAFYLGACYAAAGRDQEAVTSWRRALAGADRMPMEYAVLGDALFRLGDPRQAIAPLSEGLAKWPGDDQIRRRLAWAYGITQQYKDALDTVGPYLTRHPSDDEALLIAVQAIYASTVLGRPLVGANQDRELMTKYAGAYAAAKGTYAPLVTIWADFVKSGAVATR